ncbi:MAG: hypothetical protein ABI882_02030 [Acidobacteriota bacterium]
MKKTAIAVTILGVFALSLGLALAAPANFAGTWGLDKTKSEGLQGRQASGETTLVVTQDDKQLSYESKLVAEGQPAPAQTAMFKLDGGETTADVQGRMPGKATRKAKWMNDGSMLELKDVRNVSFQGNDFTITITDHWELADGGKTLKVHRIVETPQGPQESKLTFVKK